jgi:hypothetical protein
MISREQPQNDKMPQTGLGQAMEPQLLILVLSRPQQDQRLTPGGMGGSVLS